MEAGQPCDEHGAPLPPGYSPNPRDRNANADNSGANDWMPYTSRAQFELAELLFTKVQMSAGNIDQLMTNWAAHGAEQGAEPPFLNHEDLYDTIDATDIGHVPWQLSVMSYN